MTAHVAKLIHNIRKLFGSQEIKNLFNNPKALAKLNYKTPYFIFDENKILSNYKEFLKLFPNCTVHYAMKANSEPEVLRLLNDEGSSFEVASKYELFMLKKQNVSPERIVYGTSVKPIDHIKEFYNYGVRRFAFDSFPELEKLAQNAPGSKVYVRTIANDAGSVFKFSEKFGTDTASIIPLLLKAKELGLIPYGISFHVGSQASDPRAWANVLISLRSVIQDLKEAGITLEVINLGGGFPCKYLASDIPTLKEIAKHTLRELKKMPYEMKIIVEPGRGIIADTGILIATVIARVERRGNNWLFLDVGVYNGLFETMAYQGSTRYPISSMKSVGTDEKALFAIAGPTGDSPDVISREMLLPANIKVGDRVIIHQVGAYGLPTVSPFNGFPEPDIYYV